MPTQSTPVTDSATELHDLLGKDATATFESNPTFVGSRPTETASSENLDEQRPGAGREFREAGDATLVMKGASVDDGDDDLEEDEDEDDTEDGDEDLEDDDEDDLADDEDDEEYEDDDEDEDEDDEDEDEDADDELDASASSSPAGMRVDGLLGARMKRGTQGAA